MAHTSSSGLRHRGNVCETSDDSTYEEVYDSEVIAGATIRWCRVCGARRTTSEDDYARPVLYHCPKCGETVMSDCWDDHRIAGCDTQGNEPKGPENT